MWLNAGLQIATAAVDGVVKLWNVKKQQCVNTLELHNDKIWAMDLYETIEKIEDDEQDAETTDKYKSTIQMLTGGSDSTFKLWVDCTADQELEAKQADLLRLQEEQKLSHLIRDEDFVKAASLAFKLNKLRDFYHVMTRIISKQDEQLDQVDSVVKDMKSFENVVKSDFSAQQSKQNNKALITTIMG